MTDSLTDPLLEENRVKPVAPGVEIDHQKDVEQKDESSSWILAEIERQFWLAGPMVCVNVLQYSLTIVSLMFVGHLGELSLASASVATSFAGVTGFSVLAGMASALETLCGQAYGAKQYHMLGIYLQRAIVVLCTASIPIAFIWMTMGSLLRAVGQDPEISDYAGQYARWMLPTLFAYATLQPLVRFLQTQSAVLAMASCSALTLCLHVPICWLLIFKLGVGYRGAAIANSVSQWLNVVFLVLYIKFGTSCERTWPGFSSEAFHDIKTFLTLAVPSALMVCLEYWCFEFMVILSGLLPNPQLEMSALSISLTTMSLLYMIPFGFGASVSTRVSNELGAGRVSAAKKALSVGLLLGLTEGLIMSIIIFSTRHLWAYAFTGEPEVVDYVTKMFSFLALLAIVDACQGVLSGATRGCGNQSLGAYSNLGAYYAMGLPLGITLAFHYHLNGIVLFQSAFAMGLWVGIIAAVLVQVIALGLVAFCTNWEKQVLNWACKATTQGLLLSIPCFTCIAYLTLLRYTYQFPVIAMNRLTLHWIVCTLTNYQPIRSYFIRTILNSRPWMSYQRQMCMRNLER